MTEFHYQKKLEYGTNVFGGIFFGFTWNELLKRQITLHKVSFSSLFFVFNLKLKNEYLTYGFDFLRDDS